MISTSSGRFDPYKRYAMAYKGRCTGYQPYLWGLGLVLYPLEIVYRPLEVLWDGVTTIIRPLIGIEIPDICIRGSGVGSIYEGVSVFSVEEVVLLNSTLISSYTGLAPASFSPARYRIIR